MSLQHLCHYKRFILYTLALYLSMYIIIIGRSAAGVTIRRCKAKTLLQHTSNTHRIPISHVTPIIVRGRVNNFLFTFQILSWFICFIFTIDRLTDSHTSTPQQRLCTTIVTESIVFSSRHNIIYFLQPQHDVIVLRILHFLSDPSIIIIIIIIVLFVYS